MANGNLKELYNYCNSFLEGAVKWVPQSDNINAGQRLNPPRAKPNAD